MKIRCSYVTNSSSSSFIVSFNKIPQDAKEMQKTLFGDDMCYFDPYGSEVYKTSEVAEVVFRDMGDKATKEEIIELISNLVYQDARHELKGQEPNIPTVERTDDSKEWKKYYKDMHKYWAKLDKKCKQLAEERYKKTYANDPDLFIFSYSDNDGPLGSAMEHGDLFKNLIHTRISQH